MTDFRPASIFADDIETLESAGEALFRHHENADAIRVLAIALRLRGQTGFQKFAELTERETENERPGMGVVDAPRSTTPARSVSFACDDIDESAGLADVVELSGYSRRTPCT